MDDLSDNLTCICIAGYLVNMIVDVNAVINETHLSVHSVSSMLVTLIYYLLF